MFPIRALDPEEQIASIEVQGLFWVDQGFRVGETQLWDFTNWPSCTRFRRFPRALSEKGNPYFVGLFVAFFEVS